MPNSFFLSGSNACEAYLNLRDVLHLNQYRDNIETLWKEYQPYADSNFQTDAMKNFHQRYWEMYLTCTLLRKGFELTKVGNFGLEYYFSHQGRKIWIEAIAPNQGTGLDEVFRHNDGNAHSVQTEQIILRFTHALLEKSRKIQADLEKSRISAEDLVILAINCANIPYAKYGAELPYFIKAFLPIGNLQIPINTRTMDSGKANHRYRPEINKSNGSQIRTDNLLNPEYSKIIGILHSGVDCVNQPKILGDDFILLNNPHANLNASNLFTWVEQYSVEMILRSDEFTLHNTEAIKS